MNPYRDRLCDKLAKGVHERLLAAGEPDAPDAEFWIWEWFEGAGGEFSTAELETMSVDEAVTHWRKAHGLQEEV